MQLRVKKLLCLAALNLQTESFLLIFLMMLCIYIENLQLLIVPDLSNKDVRVITAAEIIKYKK